MKNLQNFINNLIAYQVIFSKTKKLKHPIKSLKKDPNVLPLLREKTSVSVTSELESFGIDKESIKVLQALDNGNHPILPLLLAYEHVELFYKDSTQMPNIVKIVLSKNHFTPSDLWILYDTIQNINSLNQSPTGHLYAIVYDTVMNPKNLPIILNFLPDSDQRKAYEQAKLLLQKGA